MKWDQVFDNICDSLLKVTAKYEGGAVSATGFLVARYKQPDKLAFALATAEHVFQPLPMYTDVEWMLQRYNWKGQGTGYVTFKSNLQKLGASPIRANLESDVGLLFLPKLAFETEVVRPSKSRVLDQQAVAIVHASAPFGPFNASMRRQADQIVVTSRFRFTREDGLETSLSSTTR